MMIPQAPFATILQSCNWLLIRTLTISFRRMIDFRACDPVDINPMELCAALHAECFLGHMPGRAVLPCKWSHVTLEAHHCL